jgi:hypothetical protein
MSNSIRKHGTRNIEIATRDEVHLHIQSPASKEVLVKICTVDGILEARIPTNHPYYM